MLYDLIHWILFISAFGLLGLGLGFAKQYGLYAGLIACKLVDVETVPRPPASLSLVPACCGIAFGLILGAVRIF